MKKKPKKRKNTSSNTSKLKLFAVSSLITTAFYIISFLIVAFICYKADISKDKYFIFMMIITALSSIFGGYRLTHKNNEKGLINGILGSVPIVFLTVILAVLFNNGIPTVQTLIGVIISVVFGAVSGAIAINLRR